MVCVGTERLIRRAADRLNSSFVAAASPLHGRRTLRTVPLPLRSLRQTHAAVVEPLDRTLQQKTHFSAAHTQAKYFII